ncbi:hypothetical protein TanjilG_27781 [Lupinus angustifolius]|uniref:Protein transport protein sec16 n=1 Tax=Lupinus angustifolius TaxID=3871 RepID=A0A4P1RHP6_LUPAN|nr:hypothetical protein TanjilG_27781 [Lupinus angustifolius]
MASNPPFHMEDNTDEDFFDKLIEEDDDVSPVKSGQDEGNNSDDTKAFANLSIGEGYAAFENLDAGESGTELKGETGSVKLNEGLVDGHEQEENLALPTTSVECDHKTDPHGNNRMGSEVTPASTVSKTDIISGPEIKEVGWNSFYADSNGDTGFGSYSDLFNELGDQSGDFPVTAFDNSSSALNPVNEVHNDGLNTSINYLQYQGSQGYEASLQNHTTGNGVGLNASVNYVQYQEGQTCDASLEKHANGQYSGSTQNWEDLYPGWKYDHNTGQWYQIDGYDAASTTQGSSIANTAVDCSGASDGKTDVSQSAQAVSGTSAETGTSESLSCWNQVSQGNNGYPEHMYFDPQYPGWYYDTISQEWRSLETHNSSIQPAVEVLENGHASSGTISHIDNSLLVEYKHAVNYGSQGISDQTDHAVGGSWSGLYNANHQQGFDSYTTEAPVKSGDNISSGGNQQFTHSYGSSISVNKDKKNTSSSFGSVSLYNHDHGLANGTIEPQNFAPCRNMVEQFNYSNTKFDEQGKFLNDFAENKKPFNYSQQSIQGGHQHSYAPHVGRSSGGRPPHALVTFGFGGKLIIMKDNSLLSSSCGSQGAVQGSVSMLNMMEVLMGSVDSSSIGNATGDYFRTLSQQSFPGPLVGGSVGSKELYKWLAERIAHCELPDMDYKKGERLRLLLSLLKIACQHYGKLRSPFGTDTTLKENDTPESAVAKLFASAKMSDTQYGMLSHCLQNFPSEGQLRATASEVQNLLVSGKKKEALQCAQEGQLWGPALVLASQLGEQFYVDTVKQMALRELVSGSPLRTLCLLIAGQPAEVFSTDTSVSVHPGISNMPQHSAQIGSNTMLDDWEENLAVITANRTKGDELVIVHLGDCLWKERSEITAAHICYLVAEANFEPYSDSARLCLIGADHWKYPRTYASPEAIQRTELYEYSMVLGNSQFILLSFQPYKLIYAYMLAEVGKVSDSLKYCQAVLKSLKTGRAPEVEMWRQLVSSLEDRIRTYQEGGYAANLAPAKLVGKLLNFFDSTAHRVVGGLPPPAPSSSQGAVHGNEQHYWPMSNSKSTMAMSSLVPSASMDPISDWTADNNRMTKHNRSLSEPDFGRSPRQETTSPDAQGKTHASGGTSRFSQFGFGTQLLQKTVGLVLRPRPGKQAKLGETNKFYYDEKLKRWVEEGVDPPAEEAALPPPPTTAAFQNAPTEYNFKSALKTEGSHSNEGSNIRTLTPEHSPGIPPIPPSSNQFSARSRLGVRSRYVDTFNQGGANSANMFQSPSVPSVKPALASNAKFFVPAPVPSDDHTMEAIAESSQEDSVANEVPSTSAANDWPYQSPLKNTLSASMQRFPSMGNISKQGVANGSNFHSAIARRASSWSGSLSDSFSPQKMGEMKPLGEALDMPPSTFMAGESSLMHKPIRRNSFGEELHEVEL